MHRILKKIFKGVKFNFQVGPFGAEVDLAERFSDSEAKTEGNVKYIDSPEILMWRNDNKIELTREESFDCCNPNDMECPTKFCVWNTRKDDCIKIYKKIELNKGDTVSCKYMTQDNSGNYYIALEAYSTERDKSGPDTLNFIEVIENQWINISIVMDNEYDFINLVICLGSSPIPNNGFTGTAGFIKDFKITRN